MKVVLVSCILVACVSAAKLPEKFTKCKQTDIKCLQGAIKNAFPLLASGLPDLGVPSLDPLKISKMVVGAGASVVKLDQIYQNVLLNGLSHCNVENLVFDIAKGQIKIDLSAPVLSMDADYSVNGKILLLPVYGNGTSTITLEKATGVLEFKPEIVTKKGKEFLKVSNGKLSLDCDHAVYRFENLFNGNKELGDNINNVINDNWREIYDELISGYTATYAIALEDLTNRFFSKIPLSEIFLE